YFAGTRQVEADCGGRVERIRIIGMQRKGYRQPADVLQSDCGIDSKEGRAARILPGHIHDDCGILAFVGFGDIHDNEGVAYATGNDGAILQPLEGGAWIPWYPNPGPCRIASRLRLFDGMLEDYGRLGGEDLEPRGIARVGARDVLG